MVSVVDDEMRHQKKRPPFLTILWGWGERAIADCNGCLEINILVVVCASIAKYRPKPLVKPRTWLFAISADADEDKQKLEGQKGSTAQRRINYSELWSCNPNTAVWLEMKRQLNVHSAETLSSLKTSRQPSPRILLGKWRSPPPGGTVY